jgi:cyanophycin synthetase
VIVETYLQGDDHRLLVVNGELIAATRRTPGRVIGDGKHTVRELVDIVNQDPRRGVGHEKVMTRLELDAQAEMMLARQDMSATRSGPRSPAVLLRSPANLSTGGTATDVTDIIHPDNRDMAVARSRRSASMSAASIFCAPISPRATRPSAAAFARSTPRPVFACTSRRARARRATRPGP